MHCPLVLTFVTPLTSAPSLPLTNYVKDMPLRIPAPTGMQRWDNQGSKPLLGQSTGREFQSKITRILLNLQLLHLRFPDSRNLLSLESESITSKRVVLSTLGPLGTSFRRISPSLTA